jgi:hypothetical protein
VASMRWWSCAGVSRVPPTACDRDSSVQVPHPPAGVKSRCGAPLADARSVSSLGPAAPLLTPAPGVAVGG